MKKGLSILLIAAALFGFYGGAVNLNDVLACKDYWEETGEKSTADMNKLEDGLNQLKDNEEAYLQGLKDLADGEKALADGEKAYADGQATLAQGEADYAAAPGKLAAGEKALAEGKAKLAAGYKAYAEGKESLADGKAKVAAGEEALEEGRTQLSGLSALISGINQVLNGYDGQWKPGYEQLKGARNQIFSGSKESKDSLTKLAAFLPEAARSSYVAAVNDVTDDDEKQTADDYKDFIKSTNVLGEAIPVIQETVEKTTAGANQLLAALNASSSSNLQFAGTVNNLKSNLLGLSALISDDDQKATYEKGINDVSDAYEALPSTIESKYQEALSANLDKSVEANMDKGFETFFNSEDGKAMIAQLVNAYGITEDQAKAQLKSNDQVKAGVKAAVTDQVKATIKEQVTDAVKAGYESNSDLTAGKTKLLGAVSSIADTLNTTNEQVNGDSSKLKNALLPGLKSFNSAVTEASVDSLVGGQDSVAGGISQIAAGIMSSDTLKEAVESNLGKDALALLSSLSNTPNMLSTSVADFGQFYNRMESMPALRTQLIKARALLAQAKSSGEDSLAAGESELAAGKQAVSDGEKALAAAAKKLAAGEKELAAGKAELAQGYADYKAAPAKLAEGRAALAEGLQTIMDGRAALAAGKEKLAEYEDGEQQVRDGLATLMATEADGGLTSILERRSGDADFDNGDTHLELDEGLEAVTVGRGYQSDSGELITKEITNRAIGTAAGLGAGALAVLAAILSLLKKNKGAGISAILAAAAGGAGVAMGTSAGMEFSSIAGSLVGATPWVAFGILAAVAAVFAVAHLAGKKEA